MTDAPKAPFGEGLSEGFREGFPKAFEEGRGGFPNPPSLVLARRLNQCARTPDQSPWTTSSPTRRVGYKTPKNGVVEQAQKRPSSIDAQDDPPPCLQALRCLRGPARPLTQPVRDRAVRCRTPHAAGSESRRRARCEGAAVTPRGSIEITTTAWSTARAGRLALGAEKRLAEQVYQAAAMPVMSSALSRKLSASDRLTEAKHLEGAALRALAKLCATTRDGLADAEVIEAEPLSPTRAAVGRA